MSLRTTGLIAGVIGVILLIVGFIADSVRPPEDVVAHADVSTSVVVYQPDFLTISPDGTVSFEGEGDIVAYTARPVDAEAWLSEVDYTEVTSLPDWDVLGTRDVAVAEPTPTPSPEPSGSTSASASPSPSKTAKPSSTPSATPSPSASPSASPEPAEVPTVTDPFVATDDRSTDSWRDAYTGTDRLDIPVASVPTGLTLVVMSADGSALTGTDVALTRVVNDDWITPLLWWGAILVLAGVIALVVLFIDLRPAQSRSESWMASRKSGKKDAAKAGSRRSRRAAGAAMPTASLDDATTTPDADSGDSSADAAVGSEDPPADAVAGSGDDGGDDTEVRDDAGDGAGARDDHPEVEDAPADATDDARLDEADDGPAPEGPDPEGPAAEGTEDRP